MSTIRERTAQAPPSHETCAFLSASQNSGLKTETCRVSRLPVYPVRAQVALVFVLCRLSDIKFMRIVRALQTKFDLRCSHRRRENKVVGPFGKTLLPPVASR